MIFRKSILCVCVLLLVVGCSTKKAKWANVAYHNTTAHYNVWWNGNESLKEGVAMLDKSVVDDYTQILPVYKLGSKEDAMAVYPQMDRAIEKGVKGIKKHSIFLKGEEHVPYVSSCYLLTAYGAFYKQDFVTATNTCRMMKTQFAGTQAGDEAAVLLARCATADGQYVEAESALDILNADLGKGNFKSSLREKLYMAMVESTLPQGKYKKAVQFIKMALEVTHQRPVKARLNFIMAQVYQKLDKRQVATKYYDQALRYTNDYVMLFNCHISKAACADLKHTDVSKLERDLDKMLKDKKNEEYHDQIYFAKGEMYMRLRQQQKAVENYKTSVLVSQNNPSQKAKSALYAADVYYDYFENYDAARTYYDTAMQIIQPGYPNYGDIKVRYEVLVALTDNTRVFERNDSLLRVADMPKKQRDALIQGLIDQKKRQDEEAKQKALEKQFAQDAAAQSNTLQGDWYFYNANTVQKGKETFRQRWGDRLLEDYWFLSHKGTLGFGNLVAGGNFSASADDDLSDDNDTISNSSAATQTSADINDPYKPAYYEKDLPFAQAQRDSMRQATATALLNAAYLYYDGVRNISKALECYLRLANEYPDHEDIVQAFYMLYRIYDQQGNTPSANYYRDMVLMGFPDSDFANLIRDENYYKEIAKRDQLLQDEYDELYTTFRRRRYKDVIKKVDVIAEEYPSDKMLPKFLYWKGVSYARIDSVAEASAVFKNILSSTSSNDSIVPLVEQQMSLLKLGLATERQQSGDQDAQNEEITQAEELSVQGITPAPVATQSSEANSDEPEFSTEAQLFRYRATMQHYVIIVVNDKEIRTTDLQYKLADFNTKYYTNAAYRVNPLMFTDETQLLTIHRFSNADEAMNYYTHLGREESPLSKLNVAHYQLFVISTQNYTTFYNRKNIPAYKEFFDYYYLKNR